MNDIDKARQEYIKRNFHYYIERSRSLYFALEFTNAGMYLKEHIHGCCPSNSNYDNLKSHYCSAEHIARLFNIDVESVREADHALKLLKMI